MKLKDKKFLRIEAHANISLKIQELNKIFLLLCIFSFVRSVKSQVYTEKQTRHRFAQLNLGFDFQSGLGGLTKYIDAKGNTQSLNLTSNYSPRFLIGGTHFWGHADFYIAIPLFSSTLKKENQEVTTNTGVETAFKYYPIRIENNKIRPFFGMSLVSAFYENKNNNFLFSNGPELNYTTLPILCGITLNSKKHLIEVGISWNYMPKHNYFISRSQMEEINISPYHASISYRYMIESTISAEKDWESGRTHEVTNVLANRGRLNGFYAGVGISSAFWLKQSDYNKTKRPYIGKYTTSTMPDVTFGYYLHKPDVNLAIGYRVYSTTTDTYGASQHLNRRSLLFETTKFLFDYHGFVPFIGPTISYENLSFKEDFEGQMTFDIGQQKFGYGLTFGWDIRPNRIQSLILRTNLRWYPNLFLQVEPNANVSFDNLEFNFIQLIIYLNRIIKIKPSR